MALTLLSIFIIIFIVMTVGVVPSLMAFGIIILILNPILALLLISIGVAVYFFHGF